MGKQFSGYGRYKDNAQGDAQWGFGYAGSNDNGSSLELGAGAYSSDNWNFLNATGQLGGWETDQNGFQIGLQGEAHTLQGKGTIGDIAAGLGLAEDTEEGGWQNFIGLEAHGPSANAHAHAGTDGMFAGAGYDTGGASISVGGAEYDGFFGGTEITAGYGAPGGVGANFGLHWSDDDQDGLRELGFSLGGDFGFSGVDFGIKTEALGHAYNWLFGEE